MSKELSLSQSAQYVGPYRLEKTLGKGQTGEYKELFWSIKWLSSNLSYSLIFFLCCPLYISVISRAGQARGPLYYGSEGSDQNSQQREAVWVSPDEGTVWRSSVTITMLILYPARCVLLFTNCSVFSIFIFCVSWLTNLGSVASDVTLEWRVCSASASLSASFSSHLSLL